MQGITNNPMASPSIMGVNSGAALGLAVAMIFLPDSSLNVAVLFAFGGAALATVIIMALANRNGSRMSPVFLALAGTAVSAVLLAITQALVVFFDVAQDLSYWTAGGISGVRMPQVLLLWPWTLVGIIMAIGLSKSVTLLSFGEEMAIGLGGHMGRYSVLGGSGRIDSLRFRRSYCGAYRLRRPCDTTYGSPIGRYRLPQGNSYYSFIGSHLTGWCRFGSAQCGRSL